MGARDGPCRKLAEEGGLRKDGEPDIEGVVPAVRAGSREPEGGEGVPGLGSNGSNRVSPKIIRESGGDSLDDRVDGMDEAVGIGLRVSREEIVN